ncbi:phosphotransferase family protein [Aestuariimicrobium ganziense]|uniref:phosphotransferase family protein n=1 Tax=Aestuariimicrobium ganziense TaxID=2773677 RepID=UPI001942A29D|nr:hypothetical protein [Aestuariimicrobium ganziense]
MSLPASLSDAAGVLTRAGLPGPWRFAWPDKGIHGRTVYADSADGRVVVKFAPAPPCHRRLADLGVACRMLAAEEDVHVQSYLDGTARTWGWMGEHIADVVALVAHYATDADLTDQLRALEPGATLAGHRTTVIDETLGWLAEASDPTLTDASCTSTAARLRTEAGTDNDTDLVPSHTAPNNTTVIQLRDGSLALVDWDGLCLSDPARDLGTMLWWYCARPDYDAAWRSLSLSHDQWPAATTRAHWWAAVTSLRAALWNDQHGGDAGVIASFVEDFHAAAAGRGNPKQHGSTMPVLS